MAFFGICWEYGALDLCILLAMKANSHDDKNFSERQASDKFTISVHLYPCLRNTLISLALLLGI